MTLWAAAALAFALATVGYVARWLTADAVFAAGAVGTAVFAGAGVSGAVLLALFFISGSVLTGVNARRHREPAGARRNARQVLANGTWAAVGALLLLRSSPDGWSVLVGGLAAAQSDTWATEIGRRSARLPRLITTGEPVPVGTSGGITALGTLGGVAGAFAIGAGAWLLGAPHRAAVAGFGGGIIGMVTDSLLGATLQGRFRCESCGDVTEQRVHRCGRPGTLVRGWTWMHNDVVNLLGSATGAGTALIAAWWL